MKFKCDNIADEMICFMDIQEQLYNAFKTRNIIEFKNALNLGADPFINYSNQDICVLDEAMLMPDCSDFVFECLNIITTKDPLKPNKFKNKIIAYACDSGNVDIWKVIVDRLKGDCYHLNPLNTLMSKINNENVSNVKKCLQIVMQIDECLNIPDSKGMTPLHNLIANNQLNELHKSEIVKMFLSDDKIDIDTFREGELRNILLTKYANFKLPNKMGLVGSLKHCLWAGDVELFGKFYISNQLIIDKQDKVDLIRQAIKLDENGIFEIILLNSLDLEEEKELKENGNLQDIIKEILTKGNSYALTRLLEIKSDIKCELLIRKFLNGLLDEDNVLLLRKRYECLDILMDSHKFNINRPMENKPNLLTVAIVRQQEDLVKVFLRAGAGLNVKINKQQTCLHGLSPGLLEDHFDDCISVKNNMFLGYYNITIDFKNFITPELIDEDEDEDQIYAIVPTILAMAKSKEHHYLLQHPVITGLLHLKWQKVSLIFYLNFLISIMFISSIISQIVLKIQGHNHDFILLSEIFSWLGLTYLIVRECLQLILSPGNYLKSFSNYLEILIITLSILICSHANLQYNLTVTCILLLAYELFSLVGSLPIANISTHMLMLETVCKSFAKCFLFYSIFLLTFTLCFYIKSHEQLEISEPENSDNITHKESDNSTVQNKEEEFNRFSNPLLAFVKTIVMFIGEIDAGSLNLDSGFNCFLFLSFIFFVTIILFNLLNGLAVSDTQAIRNQAEINGIICRVNMLSVFENLFIERSFFLTIQPFRCIRKLLDRIIADYTIAATVSFFPYKGNKILNAYHDFFNGLDIYNLNANNPTNLLTYWSNTLKKIFISLKTSFKTLLKRQPSTMDQRTSDNALAILAKNSAKKKQVSENKKIFTILKKFPLKN